MTRLTLSSTPVADLPSMRTDALVVGVTNGARGLTFTPQATSLDRALGRRLRPALAALGATGKAGEVHVIPALGGVAATTIAVVGLADVPGQPGHETLRRAVGDAMRALTGRAKVAVALPTPAPADVAAVAEGALLGSYRFDRYRVASKDGARSPSETVTIVVADARDRAVRAAVARAEAVCDATCFARDLVNTPPSDLHPAEFVDAAGARARKAGLRVTVLDEKALRKGGYGGIVAVGQGSVNPPRLLRVDYTHPRAKRTVALVGKGITFDSGGLSLKPSAPMEWMKSDMGGAAAVVAATLAIAALKLRVNVTAWAPLAENMPSGSAQRPSDVLTTYGGKTVEVLNTDAEGRLVLADALGRASEENPDLIVDVATLTGAQLVALGSRTSAVMAGDDDTRAQVCAAAQRAGEPMWPMPLPPELRKSLDSSIADIANMGDRYGGMLVAGVFLKEFVGERDGVPIPWAHLDIAGPAFNQQDAYGYTPKGGTGAGVRTLVALAEDLG